MARKGLELGRGRFGWDVKGIYIYEPPNFACRPNFLRQTAAPVPDLDLTSSMHHTVTDTSLVTTRLVNFEVVMLLDLPHG